MLDSAQYTEYWNKWEQSEGALLQYNFSLGNQRVISTETRPFLVTAGTQLKVLRVIQGASIQVEVNNVQFTINKLILNTPVKVIPYKSGDNTLEYITGGAQVNNFIRDWFSEIENS